MIMEQVKTTGMVFGKNNKEFHLRRVAGSLGDGY